MKTYAQYKNLLQHQQFPYACLDLSLFEQNIQANLRRAQSKKIRIASKSIRCPAAMQFILNYDNQFQGIMAYHGLEAVYLAENGFDDILLGYPVVDETILEAIGRCLKNGKYICCMVDCLQHLEIINKVGQKLNIQLPVCIDIDVSMDILGIHFGVWRSTVKDDNSLLVLLKGIKTLPFVKLDGLMGYEAQIAGVADEIKGKGMMNKVIKILKNRSLPKIKKWRKKAIDLIQAEGFELKFVNGGGTGSLESTSEEKGVTEVTVGSGFFQSHLFDNYQNFELSPAVFYGVQIVRKPASNIYTCHGGGFIASGAVESLKAPIIHLPKGGKLDKNEGVGEVQTPITFPTSVNLKIGDPVYFRHAKAGEVCERFKELTVLKETGELEKWQTYRGLGQCFG